MNKCVVYICNDRLGYIQQSTDVLSALAKKYKFDVLAGLDADIPEVVKMVGSIPCEKTIIHKNPEKYGVNWNNYHNINLAIEYGYDELIVVEDDLLLLEDAFPLTNWFFKYQAGRSNIVNLQLHSDPKEGSEDSAALSKLNQFNPWGWAITADKFKRHFFNAWNRNKMGWDHTLHRLFKCNPAWLSVNPHISRVKNIGEIGVHYVPEMFKEHFAHVKYCEGTGYTYHFPTGQDVARK